MFDPSSPQGKFSRSVFLIENQRLNMIPICKHDCYPNNPSNELISFSYMYLMFTFACVSLILSSCMDFRTYTEVDASLGLRLWLVCVIHEGLLCSKKPTWFITNFIFIASILPFFTLKNPMQQFRFVKGLLETLKTAFTTKWYHKHIFTKPGFLPLEKTWQ